MVAPVNLKMNANHFSSVSVSALTHHDYIGNSISREDVNPDNVKASVQLYIYIYIYAVLTVV